MKTQYTVMGVNDWPEFDQKDIEDLQKELSEATTKETALSKLTEEERKLLNVK